MAGVRLRPKQTAPLAACRAFHAVRSPQAIELQPAQPNSTTQGLHQTRASDIEQPKLQQSQHPGKKNSSEAKQLATL